MGSWDTVDLRNSIQANMCGFDILQLRTQMYSRNEDKITIFDMNDVSREALMGIIRKPQVATL